MILFEDITKSYRNCVNSIFWNPSLILPQELVSFSFRSEAFNIARFVPDDHVLLEDLLNAIMPLEDLSQSISFFGIAA